MIGFLLIAFSISSALSLPFPICLSDRSCREADVGDDPYRPSLSRRDLMVLAPATSIVMAVKGPSPSVESAHLLSGLSRAAWLASTASPQGERGDSCAMIAASPPGEAQEVCLSGWFTVIWNDRTRYFLSDDQGRWTELLLDEKMLKPLGGPLALNRKRVKIVGERVTASPEAVRVLSVAFE